MGEGYKHFPWEQVDADIRAGLPYPQIAAKYSMSKETARGRAHKLGIYRETRRIERRYEINDIRMTTPAEALMADCLSRKLKNLAPEQRQVWLGGEGYRQFLREWR